jgi:RNA polymerase sigma-70 factor (ECF subfamily)
MSRREEPIGAQIPPHEASGTDPEQEALLADSVGLALLVVLETLTPAERLAVALHDTFAVPFDEIAPLVGRSPETEPARARELVDALLAAARGGDFGGLLSALDPDAALVNGTVGVIGAPRGRLMMVLDFTIRDGRVLAIDVISHRESVAQLDLAVLDT